jgi:zinc transport system permease protein
VTDAYNDVSMAVVLSTGFALGTVLISLNAGGLAVGVNQYLFGNLSTVSRENAAIMLVLFGVVVGVVGLTRNQLLYVTFDATAAEVAGIPVAWYNRLMVMLTALVVVAGATQISESFTQSLLASVVLAELAVVVGIGVAYYGTATAGGVIVLVAVFLYAVAVFVEKVRSARADEPTPDVGSIETPESE